MPLTERQWEHGNALPDRITLFQRTIEEECEGDEDEIVVAIGETLIHELGHYFGLSEDEIMDIEERYWRGEPADDEPDGREGAQALRPALPRAGLGDQGSSRPSPPRPATLPRDRPGPRRHHRAAGGAARAGAGRGGRSRSRRRARRPGALPRRARSSPPTSSRSISSPLRRLAADAERHGRSASSATCPTTSRRRSCSGCSRLAATGVLRATRR